ncbi:hypothetical protein BDZ45DRAFT_669786 [Acephala macrosclerotiorum]|nr:hypothetical protein BDZ45DRAFT_669786 [Acephala macrosclerotiorum]
MYCCLAPGISVVGRETEDSNATTWARPGIAHDDLRPDNVYMGYRDMTMKDIPY